MRRVALALALFLFLAPGLAVAQEAETPISWLALERTQSGKAQDVIEMIVKHDGPMYDELLADGTLISWGIALPINHHATDDWNYLLWTTMADWSKVDTLQGGFMQMFQSRSEEVTAALEMKYEESVVLGSHRDWIVRHLTYEVNADAAPSARYITTGYFTSKPGMFGDVNEFYDEHIKPMMAKLFEDGTIAGYGWFVPEQHGDQGWTQVSWTLMPNLAALDKINAAFAAMDPKVMEKGTSMVDMTTHKDQVLMIVHQGGSPPPGN